MVFVSEGKVKEAIYFFAGGGAFFSCSALRDFSLCQDQLRGDASELGAALLCSSRAGSVYVAVIQKLYSTPGLG